MRGQPTCAANITQLHPTAAWRASVHCVSHRPALHSGTLRPWCPAPRPGVKNSLSGPSLTRPDSHSAAAGRATVHCLARGGNSHDTQDTSSALKHNCQARVSPEIYILTYFLEVTIRCQSFSILTKCYSSSKGQTLLLWLFKQSRTGMEGLTGQPARCRGGRGGSFGIKSSAASCS